MSEIISQFDISIDQVDGYEFRVKFDKEHHQPMSMDEPAPLGKDSAPNAARMLAAAIGNCLSASLLFASKKQGLNLMGLHTEVKVEIVKNENRRLRIGKVVVAIDPGLKPEEMEKARAAAAMFEDFCTVTASIRQGIPVEASIKGLSI
jgi:uncharacterized OsmC-like protein